MQKNIIKRYLQGSVGPSPDFWEGVWKDSPTEMNALSAMADSRLVRASRNYLPADARVLEGGCGNGAYLDHFFKQGQQVVGVDFTEKTVARL